MHSWLLHLYIANCLSPEFLHFLRGFAPGFVNYQKGCTRLAATCDKVYQLLAHGRWFSPGTPASSTTKTVRYDIAEILLKVALNTINQSINQSFSSLFIHDQNIFIFLHYSSIRAVSFIGGGNQSTRRKPPTCASH